MRPLLLASLLAAAVAGAPAAAAQAAERQTLDRDRPEAQFDGKFGVGDEYVWGRVTGGIGQLTGLVGQQDCMPQDVNCERTPVRLLDGGRLDFRLEEPDLLRYQNHDARLYEADASGRPGRAVPMGGGWHTWTARGVAAGDYVLVVRWWDWAGSYTGFLRLTPEVVS